MTLRNTDNQKVNSENKFSAFLVLVEPGVVEGRRNLRMHRTVELQAVLVERVLHPRKIPQNWPLLGLLAELSPTKKDLLKQLKLSVFLLKTFHTLGLLWSGLRGDSWGTPIRCGAQIDSF